MKGPTAESLYQDLNLLYFEETESGSQPLWRRMEQKDPVSAAAERTARRQTIQQRIEDREKDVKLLQQELTAIDVSADNEVEDSEKILSELMRLVERRHCDVRQQIRSQQESEVGRVKELQEKLEQEIGLLRLQDLSWPEQNQLGASTSSCSISVRPRRYFEGVTVALSETRDQLHNFLRDKWANISLAGTVLLPRPEPKTRGFSQ